MSHNASMRLARAAVVLAVILQAQTPPRSLDVAIAALQRGDPAGAESPARRATEEQPASALAWKLLGMALAAQERFEEAAEPFERACRLDPREENACYYHARNLYALSRLDDSERAFRTALRHTRQRGRVLHGMALTLEALGNHAEAEKHYREAIDSGEGRALKDYGMFLFRQGRGEESLKILRHAEAPEELARVEKTLQSLPTSASGGFAYGPPGFTGTPLAMVTRNAAEGHKYLPETMMGGVAVFDFDNDGLPDIYVTNGAALPSLEKSDPSYWNRLFRNNGDGTYTDVTEQAGVMGYGYSMGAAAADFDNDGWVDLFITGVRSNILYKNLGNGRFEDVTAKAGVAGDGKWSVSAGWLDFDQDGLLDLFVVRYVVWDPARETFCGDRKPGHRTYCHPKLYEPLPNLLYRNEGGGRFRDVSKESGIAEHLGKGMGLAIGDYDGDGRLDVFVANDTVPNFLFRNLGGGKYQEVAVEAGVAMIDDGRPISSMGVGFLDFDNDGREDIFITALSNETFPLFRNLGPSGFQDITAPSKLAIHSLPWSGWGVGMIDLDNDGHKDLFTANGHVMDNAELTSSRKSRQPNTVFRNRGDGSFSVEVLPGEAMHRGLAFADFNRDGKMDAIVTRLNEAPLVLTNATEKAGNWIGLKLTANPASGQAIGAHVKVETEDGAQWSRLMPYFGYASSSEPVVHFGLGKRRIARSIEIVWPSGCRQSLGDVAANRYVQVERDCGDGAAEPWAYIGSAACAQCHPAIYKSFRQTAMARSSGPTSSAAFREGFQPGSFRDSKIDARYRVFEEGGQHQFEFVRQFSNGKGTLDYFIGSGSVGRSFLSVRDGFLFQAPVSLYASANRWDVSPGFRGYESVTFTRPVTSECLQCHASRLQPVKGTQNGFQSPPFLEEGISCERCHGPGSGHVASVRAGHSKPAIVNPAKLEPARRDDVCAQCHLTGEARIFKANRAIEQYRPGDRLSDYVVSFVSTSAAQSRLHVTSHQEKLLQSRCKTASGDRLWCGTCHDPHSTVPASAKAAHYRNKCLSCHQDGECKERTPVRAARNYDCTACHMPTTPPVDVEHAVYTDHSIPRRSVSQGKSASGKPALSELVPVSGTNTGPRELGLAYIRVGHRYGIREAFPRAFDLLKQAAAEGADDPVFLVQLAYLFDQNGEPSRARELYEKAYRMDPSETEAALNLGSIYANEGRLSEAILLWHDALSRNPGLDAARINLALAYLRLGDPETARSTLLRALVYSPDLPAAQRLLEQIPTPRK